MSSKKELIKKLKSDRKQVCGQLDRFYDFIQECDQMTNKIKINERFVRCELLWDDYNKIQLELEYLEECTESDRLIFEEKYFETVCMFKELLSRDISQSNTSNIQGQISSQQIAVKLPPLDLPCFSGNYDSWLGFYDTFVALIHSNGNLSNVQKFYYLQSCLKGDAAQVIHSIEINDLNYEIAFRLLRERYENKKFIIHSHVKCLFELAVVGKNTLVDLRNLVDTIQKNLRALKSLKEPVDTWDTLLLYMFSNKLDLYTKREWETFCVRTNNIKCDDFIKFLIERCHVLENMDSHKSYGHSQQSSNKPAFKGQKISQSYLSVENSDNCLYCKANRHPILSLC